MGKYFCGWCASEFKQEVNKLRGHGKKGRSTDQAVCPKCNNCVSQKN